MYNILVIGSGELGHAIITSLQTHPSFGTSTHSLTTTVRPSTLSSPSKSRATQLAGYKAANITLLPLDIESASTESLGHEFQPFTMIIHAGGMTLSPGTQMKVTEAVLASAKGSLGQKTYIPWQFGLDYEVIGPDAGDGLFREQCQIRELLRSQSEVEWVIVSNGIFMSFMFEPVWGVVESEADGGNGTIVRALGAWEDKLVITTAEDIARCTTELVLVDTEIRGKPVYIAGDSISYGDFANTVGRVTGKEVVRELWDTSTLQARLKAEPDNKLRQYHVVFSQGIGTNWAIGDSYNVEKGIKTEGVEAWMQKNFKTS